MKTNRLMTRLHSGLLAGALLILLAGPARAAGEDEIERTFTVGPGGRLVMDVDRGSINVKTIEGDSLTIKVMRKALGRGEAAARILDDHAVTFEQEGDELRVESEYAGGTFGFRGVNLQVRYLVTAPKQFNVQLKTSGGSVSVTDLEGKAEVRSSGGSLSFGQIGGGILGRTSGGGITVAGSRESVDLSTSGGSIKIGQAEGEIIARTSGGGITLEDIAGRVEASTSGGSVTARFTKQPTGDCSLKTSGGSIRLSLPADAAIDLDARTSGGRVTTDFPDVETGDKRGTSLKTRLNGGGPSVTARTSGGSVEIRAR